MLCSTAVNSIVSPPLLYGGDNTKAPKRCYGTLNMGIRLMCYAVVHELLAYNKLVTQWRVDTERDKSADKH